MCYENNQKAFLYIQCTADAKMQKCSVLQTDAKQSYWLGNTPSTKQNKNKKTAF